MRTILCITALLLISIGLNAQTRLEVEGEAKITVLRNTTTSDENLVRKADGNLAIRKYSVGHFAHGGIVFWVDESGEHGLVCVKNDQHGGVRWYAGTDGVTHAKGNGPFSGEMNTMLIIATQVHFGDDGNIYAARICSDLIIQEGDKAYGDWYLPSLRELETMDLHKAKINATAVANGGTIFADARYWSSTENNLITAMEVDFADDGDSSAAFKSDNQVRVRAIRAF